MKKLIFIILALTFHLTTFGQIKKHGVSIFICNPNQYNSIYGQYSEYYETLTIDQNSYSTGIILNYKLTDTVSIHLRTGLNKINISQFRDDFNSGYYYTVDYKEEQNNYILAPGLTWNLNYRKFNFFGGFEIPFNILGKRTGDWYNTSYDSLTMNMTKWNRNVTTIPKGFSIGGGALFGFNYYPFKWVAIGTEYSPSLSFINISGDITHESTGSVSPFVVSEPIIKYKSHESFFFEQRLTFKISIWF